MIFLINSCGGGGSSAILIPDIEPPGNSYQATVSDHSYDYFPVPLESWKIKAVEGTDDNWA